MATCFTAVLAMPVLLIMASLLQPFSTTWQHLNDTLLTEYVFNTTLLVFGVGIGSLGLGVSSAWLSALCEFPGRRLLSWALLLPMAMPAYIIAYTYSGILDSFGILQITIRSFFGWDYGDYYFPQIRSLGGAICMLSLVLYPYVYLLARVAFAGQSLTTLESSRNLGRGPWNSFLFVSLPLARPAIVAGLSLAMMETLADYGTVSYFGVNTFTTGIFRTWHGLGELLTAAQLCAFLLLFVFALMLVERESRNKLRYYQNFAHKNKSIRLKKWHAVGAVTLLSFPIIMGFILPATQLAVWAINYWRNTQKAEFFDLLMNSIILAGVASVLCLIFALFLSYIKRRFGGQRELVQTEIVKLGYAVPGTVVAVGVMLPAGWLDQKVNELSVLWIDDSLGLLFSGTLGILLFAYLARFLSISLQAIESGMSTIKPKLDESALSLGASPSHLITRIHLPLLRPSLFTALLLVFVEVLKELPITLILRPFNFNTLAIRTYELASEEQLMDAALPALSIVAIGLVPVLLITRIIIQDKN
ncbi:MAG: iron ABC transporter permease [Porticoccaceae bacterium]|nr:iron ABC transporter permease [Porticoccaceae bacterium]